MTNSLCAGCGEWKKIVGRGYCNLCYNADWRARHHNQVRLKVRMRELTYEEKCVKRLFDITIADIHGPDFILAVDAFMWFGSDHFKEYYGYMFRNKSIWSYLEEVLNDTG